MIEQILYKLYEGIINPLEAVIEADHKIGGITGVKYRKGLTLENHTKRESIAQEGLSKKEKCRLIEFATLAYWKAQQNKSISPGEIHIDKGISSKHYKLAFINYMQELLIKYAA